MKPQNIIDVYRLQVAIYYFPI